MKKKEIHKVIFYGRVSTVNNSQDSSIENQIALAENFLKKHPELVLAEPIDTYVERVSAKSDRREKYIEMLIRLKKRDISYLLVKDLKRLSRSAEVSAQIRRICKTYGFKLILLDTGKVYDFEDESNRFMYSIESALNEEVVFRQSTYGRIAHKQKMEAKRLNRQNETFAHKWDYDINDMVICEEKAEVIRQLFDKLVFQDMGVVELQSWLESISIKVSKNTIRKWIHETAFVGVFHMNKKGSELGVGAGQKTKRYMNPKEEWVAVERPDLRILEQEIFDLAQRIMARRKVVYDGKTYDQERFHGTHLFSGKIFCKECGSPFVHYWGNRDKTISVYKDSRKKKTECSCKNENYNRIYETDLAEIALAAINGFITEHEKCFSLMIKAIEQALTEGVAENKGQIQLRKLITKEEKEAEKLLSAYLEADGAIKLALAEKYEKQSEKLESLKAEIREDTDEKNDKEELKHRINNIRCRIEKMKEISVLDRDTVLRFINRIEIDMFGKIEVYLNTEAMYQSQVNAWKDRKQSSNKKAAFFMPKTTIKYVYSQQFYFFAVGEITSGMMEA